MEEKGQDIRVFKADHPTGNFRLQTAGGGLLYTGRGKVKVTVPPGPFDCQVRNLLLFPPDFEAIISISEHSECYLAEMSRSLAGSLKASGVDPAILRWSGLGSPAEVPALLALPEDHEGQVLTFLNRMAVEEQRKKPGFEAMQICLFTELLLYLFRNNLRPVRKPGAKSPEEQALCVRELAGYIEKNSSEDFSLDGLAEHCGLNPSYLSRSFREQTGTALFEFINEIRVKKACQLLKNTDLPVIDVAYTVGYNSLSFFNRYFRRIMDMSPVEYRAYSRK